MNTTNLVNLKKQKIKIKNLTEHQKEYLHLIDPRLFAQKVNPYRKGKTKKDYFYITDLTLTEEELHLHFLMDPMVLEQGNVRRFPAGVNKKYIKEKYFDDKWVSNGNNKLAIQLEKHIKENINSYKKKKVIKLLDIGPCGGAITTLFALRPLAKYNLLDKVKIYLLDIVPNVLEATILGEYIIPQEMIKEYKLNYAGKNGKTYKNLLSKGILYNVKNWYKTNPKNIFTDKALKLSDKNKKTLTPEEIKTYYYRGDGEKLPQKIRNIDIVLAGYTHHHLNLPARKSFCQQMEIAGGKGSFIGVADFYVKNYKEYMKWYKHHFIEYNDAPPVEYPLIDGETIAKWYKKTKINYINNNLHRSYVFAGTKK